jgi:exosortase
MGLLELAMVSFSREINREPENVSMTTRNQFLAFAILCVVSIVFWWRPLVLTLNLALANDAYTHILLVLPLSLALIYLDRKIPRMGAQDYSPVALAVLFAAVLIACVARWSLAELLSNSALSINMVALVVWWIGSVVLCFGAETFRTFLFPLWFLFWIVPAPEWLLDPAVRFLQYQSAFGSRLLFHAVGVPATQDGVMLSIPNLDIEVATECSSIRSSMMLILITMVLGQLFLRSPWRKTLLIAAAVPLSVAKNALRIVTIAALGTRVDPGYLHGNLHRQGGIIFLGIAVAAEVLLLWILRRPELRGVPENASPLAAG